jgi:hypothetical protein
VARDRAELGARGRRRIDAVLLRALQERPDPDVLANFAFTIRVDGSGKFG